MSGVCKYWVDKREGDGYKCPWCARDLKSKLSKSEKNPDRPFVSCDKKFGGCGLFCFLDDQPKEQFNPNKQGGGSIFGGSYAAKPPTENMEIATIKAKIATIESQLATVFADLAQLQGVRDEQEHSDHSNEAARKKPKKSTAPRKGGD